MRPATISNLRDSTTEDAATGAVRSVQAADLSLPEPALRMLWSALYLERLARTYWRFLTRVTLGLVRVRYSDNGRALVLLAPALKLIVFASPEYELQPGHGIVRWRITSGLLVARRGHESGGYLQIEVRRLEHPDESQARLHVEVAVEGFYPAIASGLGRRFYRATQSRIHVLITHAFLRSLARLDLAESRVGRFAG
ncbi:MAG TPA: hypothetical protein VMG80_05160 [Solirubrobacteraceae bacterium]|nr:hypothetical protein [Solirubrobacteraceae bacterium]